MPVDPDDLINFAELRLLRYKPVVTQNGRNQLYFNPRALAAFLSTTAQPTLALSFRWLSETELALFFVEPNPPYTIPFSFAQNRNTGSFPFTPFLIERPILRATSGKQNQYAYRIDALEDGSKRFVLILANPKVEPVSQRSRGPAKE